MKKIGKWRGKLEKTCIDNGMQHWKLKIPIKTRFANKIIISKENLEFKQTTLFCYGRHNTLTLQQKILKAQVHAIIEVVIQGLNFMVTTCVMNYSKGHQLLSNALVSIINLIIDMKYKLNPFFDGNEFFYQFRVEFHLLNRNMQKEVESNKFVLRFFENFSLLSSS